MQKIDPEMPLQVPKENMIIIKPLQELPKYSLEFLEKVDKYVPKRFKGSEITDSRIKQFIFSKTYNNSFTLENKIYPAQFYGEKGLYIYGNCGVGKTKNLYGVYRILRGNFQKSISLQFTNITDFFSELKQTFDGPHSEQNITEKIKTDNILFLDDFGVEKLSEWTLEAAYRLINHRYEQMKPTFISSNLSLTEIAERMGDRFSSRIAEMCEIIKIEGKDMRLKLK